MLCAHTVRRLKPGSLDQFARRRGEGGPAGRVPLPLLRGLADENELVTFGFFDGTLEELERSQADADYESRRDAIDPFVDAVIANGVYGVATTDPGSAAAR